MFFFPCNVKKLASEPSRVEQASQDDQRADLEDVRQSRQRVQQIRAGSHDRGPGEGTVVRDGNRFLRWLGGKHIAAGDMNGAGKRFELLQCRLILAALLLGNFMNFAEGSSDAIPARLRAQWRSSGLTGMRVMQPVL